MSITLKTRTHPVELKWWTFPGGERNVKIVDISSIDGRDLFVTCKFEGSNDLVDMLLLVNAIRSVDVVGLSHIDIFLNIPYFPFARQDRVMTEGEPFALQVAVQLIKACNFKTITVLDPHSDVLAGMFEPGVLKVVSQWDTWNVTKLHPRGWEVPALVSPDAGALKKIYKLAAKLEWPVIQASKERDVATGKITATSVASNYLNEYTSLYIVDDICDGGRTFIELAKAIREKGFKGALILCVTHGIFSQGLEALEVFDKIYCENNINNTKLNTFNTRKI